MIKWLLPLALLMAIPACAQFPAMDTYGGLTGVPTGSITGSFHTGKLGSHLILIDPLGNAFQPHCMYSLAFGDGGNEYGLVISTKYSSTTQWANFQLGRMKQYGFNCISAYSSQGNYNVYPLESFSTPAASPQLPFLYHLGGADICLRGTTASPIYPYAVKSVYNGTNANIYTSGGRALLDPFDPAFSTCVGDLVTSTGDTSDAWGGGFNGGIPSNSPWLLGFWSDDTDNLFGSRGFGEGWAGYISTITNPYQLSCPGCDRNVYSKQHVTTFLQAEYGSGAPGLAALNAAWGSAYTSWTSTTFSWSGANTDAPLLTGNGSISSYTNVELRHPGVTAGTVIINVTAAPSYMQLAIDNFTRANGGLGANWTTATWAAAPAIVSDVAQDSSTIQQGSAIYNNASWTAAQYDECTIGTWSASSGFSACTVFESSSADSWYSCDYHGGTDFRVDKTISGSYTNLSSSSTSFASGDVIRTEVTVVSGVSTIICKKNGTQIASATDSQLTSGTPGIILYSGDGNAAHVTFSNWDGGTIIPASALKIGQDNGSGSLVGTGCTGTPCITSGSITYTSGNLTTLVLASSLPNGAIISASYTGNAWPAQITGGTGLWDEDGSSAWFPAAPNSNPYPTGGDATLLADMDKYEFAFYDQYFGTYKMQIKASFPNNIVWGPGDLSPQTSPEIFAAAAKDLDVVEEQLGDTAATTSTSSFTAPCDAAITFGYPCIPQVEYTGLAAWPDSEMTAGWNATPQSTCNITGGTTNQDYTLQTLRGACYIEAGNRWWNATAANGVQPAAGLVWWEWVDNTINGMNNNYGIVSSRDNPYGLGLDTSGPPCNETQGSITVTDCTELSTRGDFLTDLIAEHVTLFDNLNGLTAGGTGVHVGILP